MYLKPAAVKIVVDLNQVDTKHVRIPRNFQGVQLIFKSSLKFIIPLYRQGNSEDRGGD